MSVDLYPESEIVGKIPKCSIPTDCTSIGYFILGRDEEWIHSVMQSVADQNDLQYGTDVKNLLITQDQ